MILVSLSHFDVCPYNFSAWSTLICTIPCGSNVFPLVIPYPCFYYYVMNPFIIAYGHYSSVINFCFNTLGSNEIICDY